jgi:hypothetical protein
MLGTLKNARTAREIDRDGDYRDGWKKLANGANRTAYLGPDGLVYKVGYGNDTEYQTFEYLSSRYDWAPEFNLIDDVMVMPFYRVPDSESEIYNNDDAASRYDEICNVIEDMHVLNVAFDNANQLVVIDAGWGTTDDNEEIYEVDFEPDEQDGCSCSVCVRYRD